MATVPADPHLAEGYFLRMRERLRKTESMAVLVAHIYEVALSGEKHFERLRLAHKRHERAQLFGDHAAMQMEKSIMHALLYEAADTSFLVMNLLDFDQFELQASVSGSGLAGESAAEITRILHALEQQCRKLHGLEHDLGLALDYSRPLDEKEGITFHIHRHWQDFVPGSVPESFNAYFSRARFALLQRLAQRPRCWGGHQSIRQYLQRGEHAALLTAIDKLEKSHIPA
jgi:hypothetical protein